MKLNFNNIEGALDRLKRSRFRAGQRLNKRDLRYYLERNEEVTREHARNFIKERLAPARPRKDGKQTPFRGHPVFTAQHATGTCCRKCLARWHDIEMGRELTETEVEVVAELIMRWLREQIILK